MKKFNSRKEACQVLGLPENASEEEIKTSFKKLAKFYHPDEQPNEALHWQYYDVTDAYHYLMSEKKTPRVLGGDAALSSWTTQRRAADADYAKWEKKRKQIKNEKNEKFEEKQRELRRQRQYDEAMKQINAIRTARAIEAMLRLAKEQGEDMP